MKEARQTEAPEGAESAKDRRKHLVQQEIIDQACQIFARKGYDGTTLGDIAEAMGMTRAAIYYYFRNKEAVLTALMDDITRTPLRDIADWHTRAPQDCTERLRDFVRLRVRGALQRQVQLRVVQIVEAALPEQLSQAHAEAKRKILAEYRSIIRDGISCGRFRAQDDRVAALAIIGMINWTIYWAAPERPQQSEEIAEQLAEMAVQAMLTPPGTAAAGEPQQIIASIRGELDRLSATIGKG